MPIPTMVGVIAQNSVYWKYEFCYGRNVIQYYVEADGTKSVINLGNFVKSAHIDWLKANPKKMPKPLSVRTQVSHYYSGGTICAKTGKPRFTEVKLKCPQKGTSQGAVSMYLLEPMLCEYTLIVESKIICELLMKVDEYGLYDLKEELGFSKASYQSGYKPSQEEHSQSVEKEQEKDESKSISNKMEDTGSDGVRLENHIPDGDD